MKRTFLLAISASMALGACASPKPPTMTAQDLTDSQSTFTTLNGLGATPTADMPSGSATFNGKFGGEVTGDSDGSILGDLTLNTNFDTSAVTGSVTNINAFDDNGDPDQLLSGSLDVNGNISGNGMTATAQGTLTGVDSGFAGDTNANVTMNGTFRNNTATADTVTGTAVGCASGDFDICMNNGQFYAER